MNKSDAVIVQQLALSAIESLTKVLAVSEPLPDEPRTELKRGVGLTIGLIETEILSMLYRFHPELDTIR